MSESSVIDWLNENSYRAYPLTGEVPIAEDVLLDLQLYYTELPPRVQLLSIVGTETEVTFTFTGNLSLSILKSVSFPHYTPRTANGSFLVVGAGMADLTGTFNFTNCYVEPELCFEFQGAWLGVTSVTAAQAYTEALPLQEVPAGPLTGSIQLVEGYHVGLNIVNNLISISAGASHGKPTDCSTRFLDPDYCDCAEIISYINGVMAKNGKFTLAPGQDFRVFNSTAPNFFDKEDFTRSANPHTLFAGFNFASGDVCNTLALKPAP